MTLRTLLCPPDLPGPAAAQPTLTGPGNRAASALLGDRDCYKHSLLSFPGQGGAESLGQGLGLLGGHF